MIFGEIHPVAKKIYECNASLFMIECLDDIWELLTKQEKKEVNIAQKEGWKILPGQRYRKYNWKDGLDISWSNRERIEISKICIKYDLYPPI